MENKEIAIFVISHIHTTGKYPSLIDIANHFNVTVMSLMFLFDSELRDYYDIKVIPKTEKYNELVKEYNERMFEMLKSTGGMHIPLRSDNPAIRWDRKHLKLIIGGK